MSKLLCTDTQNTNLQSRNKIKKTKNAERLRSFKLDLLNYKFLTVINGYEISQDVILQLKNDLRGNATGSGKVYYIKKNLLKKEFSLDDFQQQVLCILTDDLDFIQTYKYSCLLSEGEVASETVVVPAGNLDRLTQNLQFDGIEVVHAANNGKVKMIEEDFVVCTEGESISAVQSNNLKLMKLKIGRKNFDILLKIETTELLKKDQKMIVQ